MEPVTAPAPGAPAISPDERRRGMRLSVFEGMSAQAQTCCTGLGMGGPNPVTTGFALLLGTGELGLGLLAGLPVLGNVLQYLAVALAPRLKARRPIVAVSSTIARVAWLPIGAIPFLIADKATALGVFLLLWMVTNALLSLSANLWISWMADLVPPAIRGRYFSLRNRATTVVNIVVPLALSLAFELWFGGMPRSSTGPDAALQARGFAVAFGLAAGFGLLCCFLLFRQPEPVRATGGQPLALRDFLAPWRDVGFRPLLIDLTAFGATNGISNPFWTPFHVQQLGLGFRHVNGLFVVLTGAAMALSLPFWGRLSDRLGHRRIMAIALCLICSQPLYYVFASRPSLWWLMIFDQVSSGISWAGYNMALQNLVLALAPRERRELYWATQAVLIGLAQALTSGLSGEDVHLLPAPLPLLGLSLHPRQQTFLATSVLRMACLVFFVRAVREPPRRFRVSSTVAASPDLPRIDGK